MEDPKDGVSPIFSGHALTWRYGRLANRPGVERRGSTDKRATSPGTAVTSGLTVRDLRGLRLHPCSVLRGPLRVAGQCGHGASSAHARRLRARPRRTCTHLPGHREVRGDYARWPGDWYHGEASAPVRTMGCRLISLRRRLVHFTQPALLPAPATVFQTADGYCLTAACCATSIIVLNLTARRMQPRRPLPSGDLRRRPGAAAAAK